MLRPKIFANDDKLDATYAWKRRKCPHCEGEFCFDQLTARWYCLKCFTELKISLYEWDLSSF